MSDYDDGSEYRPNSGPQRGENTPPPPPVVPPGIPAANAQDSYSVAAMLTGILAVILGLFCGLLAIPVGIVAIYLGIQGRKRSQAMGKGTGLATAGAVLGGVSIVLTLVFFGLVMILGNSGG